MAVMMASLTQKIHEALQGAEKTMGRISKKAAIALLSVVVALTLMVPALSFAQATAVSTMTGLVEATTDIDTGATSATSSSSAASTSSAASDATSEDEPSVGFITAASNEPTPGEPSAEFRPVGTCTATINYMEYPWEEDPNKPTDEGGRVLLGTLEVTGLHEGDVLNAWDYVVDIPGHFFFDGWPFELTVSSDPAQNVFTLIYVKLWNCEYTVNYYVMEGADLTANNWSDALKPETVTFTKVGSETIGDQIFDTLVDGDAYEYQVDGMYVIDTYPAEIRVGVDPDDNVINVLYTTTYATGPDSFEVPTDYAVPDDVPMPDDTTFDKDDLIEALPDGVGPGSDIYDDFLGTTVRPGELVVTDEMLQHPVNKEQATLTAQAYATGLHQSSDLAQTGDIAPWVIAGLIVLVIVMALFIVWLGRRGHHVESDTDR